MPFKKNLNNTGTSREFTFKITAGFLHLNLKKVIRLYVIQTCAAFGLFVFKFFRLQKEKMNRLKTENGIR